MLEYILRWCLMGRREEEEKWFLRTVWRQWAKLNLRRGCKQKKNKQQQQQLGQFYLVWSRPHVLQNSNRSNFKAKMSTTF